MRWLSKFAEKIANYVMRKARFNSGVSAREFEAWKHEYKQDFGKDFKEKNNG